MVKQKPYIARVLEALYHFSIKRETVTSDEIFQWLAPKITMTQLNAALSNYNVGRLDLIEKIKYNEWRLKNKNIIEVYNKYLNGKIKLWVNNKKKDQTTIKVISAETIEDNTPPMPIESAKIGSENDRPIEASSDEIEAIEAAQVGAAIIAYVRKLQKQQSKTDIGKQQAKIEDQAQTIINQQNQINDIKGQLSKLQKMYETQNKKLIELNHNLETEKKKNDDLKTIKSPTSSFKVSDVARITKLVKGI